MNDEFKNKLQSCSTLREVFDLVNSQYNTDKSLGMITGMYLKDKIPEIIALLKLAKK